jgi:hypothetical protein
MSNQNVRPITLTLSNRHVEMMVKTHRLKEADINDVPKVAQIAQQIVDEALGLPEDAWHAWDDWAKALE